MLPFSSKLYKPQKTLSQIISLFSFFFFFFKCSTKVIQHTDIPMASYTFYPISSYRFWLRDEENHLTEMATFLNNGFFIFLMG